MGGAKAWGLRAELRRLLLNLKFVIRMALHRRSSEIVVDNATKAICRCLNETTASLWRFAYNGYWH